MNKKPLCGIDEAGRGPLAGSLVMAGGILKSPGTGLMDSKKLTEKKREALYPLVIENSEYHIVSFSRRKSMNWVFQSVYTKVYKVYRNICLMLTISLMGTVLLGLTTLPRWSKRMIRSKR